MSVGWSVGRSIRQKNFYSSQWPPALSRGWTRTGPRGGGLPVSSIATSIIKEGAKRTRRGPGGGGPHLQYPLEPPASSTRRKTRRGPVGREPQATWRTGREGGRRSRRLRSPNLIEEEEKEGARRAWAPPLIKRTGQRGQGGCQEEESPQPYRGGGQGEEEGPGGRGEGQEEGGPRLLESP